MADMNRVFLLGNLTRDPEIKYTGSGLAICKLGLAVNQKRKSGDEWVEETTFVDIDVFGRQAETSNEYLAKGRQVLIEGRLRLDQWEKDGQKRSKLKVVADRVTFIGGRGEGGGGGGGGGTWSSSGGGGGGARPQGQSGGPPGGAPAGGSGGAPGGGGGGEDDNIPF